MVFGLIIILIFIFSSVQSVKTIDKQNLFIESQQDLSIGIGIIICKTGEQQLPGYLITPARANLKLNSEDETVNRVNNRLGFLQPIIVNDKRIGSYSVRAFFFLPLNIEYEITATYEGVTKSKSVYLSNTQFISSIEFIFMSAK